MDLPIDTTESPLIVERDRHPIGECLRFELDRYCKNAARLAFEQANIIPQTVLALRGSQLSSKSVALCTAFF